MVQRGLARRAEADTVKASELLDPREARLRARIDQLQDRLGVKERRILELERRLREIAQAREKVTADAA